MSESASTPIESNGKAGLGRSVSIRSVLLVLLVGQIFFAVGLTWWLWYRNGQEAVQQVEEQLTSELATRIEDANHQLRDDAAHCE